MLQRCLSAARLSHSPFSAFCCWGSLTRLRSSATPKAYSSTFSAGSIPLDPASTSTVVSSTQHVAPQAQDAAAAALPLSIAAADEHRRSFKVALPAEALLKQVVVQPEQPVDLTLRSYHVGSRIHIGRVLAHLRHTHPECRTTAGKDYAIIWLDDLAGQLHSRFPPVGTTTAAVLARLLHNIYPSMLRRQQARRMVLNSMASIGEALATHSQKEVVILPRVDLDHIPPAAAGSANPPQQQQQQQASDLTPAQPHLPSQAAQEAAAEAPAAAVQQQQQQRLQPPFMAVYRVGSVVFGGLEQREELLWLSHFVPPPVRYTGEEGSPWTRGRSAPSLASQEVQKVVVDPNCPDYAVQGTDELRLRVLDVGGVRVLTAVLAQSAALKFYEESVNKSLARLADWRAVHSSSRASRSRGIRGLLGAFSSYLFGSKQDIMLFKVIAASALIINESQQLLEVAEPAWQYDTYSTIWGLMAKDQQLEPRINNLATKLHQVETEAKHDVKARAGRRSRKLDQGIIVLLLVSCMLAAFEAGIRFSHQPAPGSSSDGGVEGDGRRCEAECGGDGEFVVAQ